MVGGSVGITKQGSGTLVYSNPTGNTTANSNTGTLDVAEGPVLFSKAAAAIAGPLIVGNYSNSANNGLADTVTVTNSTNQLNNQAVTINGGATLNTQTAPRPWRP